MMDDTNGRAGNGVNDNTQIQHMKCLRQESAAWLIGIKARHLRKMPDAPRNSNGTYNAEELVAWNTSRKAENEDDALMAGARSETKDRYLSERTRLVTAQANQRELDLAEQRGKVMPLDLFDIHWKIMMKHFSGAIETAQRRFGPDIHDIFQRAMDAADKESRKILGSDDPAARTDACWALLDGLTATEQKKVLATLRTRIAGDRQEGAA